MSESDFNLECGDAGDVFVRCLRCGGIELVENLAEANQWALDHECHPVG